MKKYFLILFLANFLIALAQPTPSNDTLIWHSGRPLNWTDFKGEVIDGIGLTGEILCMNLANYERKNALLPLSYTVNAVYDRNKSWIAPKLRTKQALLYFQTTFDIYELHARKLRKQFYTTTFDLDANAQFQKLYNASMTELMTEFNEYRKATKLGTLATELKKWRTKVNQELAEFDAYKN